MKFFRIILYSFIIITLSTCKKYPDGGLVSLTYKHLFGGRKDASKKSWELHAYIVNGIDSTNLIAGVQDIPNFKKNFADFVVSDWRTKHFMVYRFLYSNSIEIDKTEKTLKFTSSLNSYFTQNDSSQCFTNNNTMYCERNIFNPEYNKPTMWNISKLTKNKLELTTTITNNYKIILVNKD